MSEFEGPEVAEVEKKPSVEQLIEWGEKALRGELQGDLNEYTDAQASENQQDHPEGEFDLDDGVILDQNSAQYTENEQNQLLSWIENKLESPIDTAPVQSTFTSPDESGSFQVFAKEFGTPDNPWFITKWQNEGERPSIVIWSKDMIEFQEEMSGYIKNEP